MKTRQRVTVCIVIACVIVWALLLIRGGDYVHFRKKDDFEETRRCLRVNEEVYGYRWQSQDMGLRMKEVREQEQRLAQVTIERTVHITIPHKEDSEIPLLLKGSLKQWERGGFKVVLHDDEDMERLVREVVPELGLVWGSLAPILRTDIWRYAALSHLGGFYADADCFLLAGDGEGRDWASLAASSFVVGAERARGTPPRPVKFAQWFFGAQKDHIILRWLLRAIQRERDNIVAESRNISSSADWLEFVGLKTGPHLFSDILAAYLCYVSPQFDLKINYARFWAPRNPPDQVDVAGGRRRSDDDIVNSAKSSAVLTTRHLTVCPIASFAANQPGHGNRNAKDVLVWHQFDGSAQWYGMAWAQDVGGKISKAVGNDLKKKKMKMQQPRDTNIEIGSEG